MQPWTVSSTPMDPCFFFTVVVVVARLIWPSSLLLLFVQEEKLSFVLHLLVWPPFFFLVVVQPIHASRSPFPAMNRVPAISRRMTSIISSFSRHLLSFGMKQALSIIMWLSLWIALCVISSIGTNHLEASLCCLVETSDKSFL